MFKMLFRAAFALGVAATAMQADPAPAKEAPTKEGTVAKAAMAEEFPPLSVTAHSVTVNGTVLHYHATAGYIMLKTETGKSYPKSGFDDSADDKSEAKKEQEKTGLEEKARVFFVAYTLDGVTDPASRPVTFAFNGGPGSASIWLHMEAIAPRRAELTPEGEAPPPPYRLVDNESTWLDRTDLVFIDPVSTGYSRAMPKEDAKQFHGLKEDIASVGDFIRLYTSRNERWLSPKFVLGESYGTTRAAGLSDYLQGRYGLYLNGIILVSSVLDFQALEFTPQNNDPYIGFLPSYATVAWYHKKLAPAMEAKPVEEVAAEARQFAGRDYALALMRGDTLSADETARIAAGMNRFTGLNVSYLIARKLRVPDNLFFTHLLWDEGRVLGRYDARFTGLRYEPDTDAAGYDPSSEAVAGPLTAAFNDYIRRELKFDSDLTYEAIANVYPWNFGNADNGFPDTAEDLRQAMTRNPYLKVWVTCSYFDLATPFYSAENVVASMQLDPSIRGNLRFTYYKSGHMLYIRDQSRRKFKSDFESFLHDALNEQPIHAASRIAP